jgi:nitrogen fixation-related uncharacterized protein
MWTAISAVAVIIAFFFWAVTSSKKQGGQGEELKQTRAENELNKQINSIDHSPDADDIRRVLLERYSRRR